MEAFASTSFSHACQTCRKKSPYEKEKPTGKTVGGTKKKQEGRRVYISSF